MAQLSEQPRDDKSPFDSRSSSQSSRYADESPDLLRWRADALMDEMMLGAVDVSAAGNPGRTEPPAQLSNAARAYDANGDGQPYHSPRGGPAPDGGLQGFQSPDARGGSVSISSDESTSSSGAWGVSDSAPQTPPPIARVEERYARSPVDQADSTPSARVAPESAARPRFDNDIYASAAGGLGYDRAQGVGSARSIPPDRVDSGAGSLESLLAAGADPYVRRYAYASAMSVASPGERRSNLLPRMSGANVQALQQEIVSLRAQIDAEMPVNHEANIRANHLLDKAGTILESDPQRTAEVEYYIQQVRSIVRRIEQTHQWSSIYRRRLQVYLVAWLSLSLIVLISCAVYQLPLEIFVATFFGLSVESVFVQHSTALLSTIFAGALGGAVGVLLSMRRQVQNEVGFLDRKYGLRGLILPIIGALFGLLLYLPFGLIYHWLGIDPALSLLAGSVPVLLSFVFGFSQESIYGTRD